MTANVFAEWCVRRVNLDYHVNVADHYYSVPHRFVRAEVEVRLTACTWRSSTRASAMPRISA
ncbi:hypothetical protein SAMN05216330_1345 [Bradyrhizobium sp. Ghvi]|nr:hypothetical protein SAMN05216330_1345 [Bradyrhizobium sp. Ghvi]